MGGCLMCNNAAICGVKNSHDYYSPYSVGVVFIRTSGEYRVYALGKPRSYSTTLHTRVDCCIV